MELKRNREIPTIVMNKRSYIKEVFNRFNMEKSNPVGIPFNGNSKMLKLSNEEFRNGQREIRGVPYKAKKESLLIAMVGTRADVTFAVNLVSQFMSKAGPLHWMGVKRIMRYSKGTLTSKYSIPH